MLKKIKKNSWSYVHELLNTTRSCAVDANEMYQKV